VPISQRLDANSHKTQNSTNEKVNTRALNQDEHANTSTLRVRALFSRDSNETFDASNTQCATSREKKQRILVKKERMHTSRTYYKLHTTHYPLLTTHYSLLTTHYSLHITHHTPNTKHYTTRYVPHITRTPLATRCSLLASKNDVPEVEGCSLLLIRASSQERV
jgi:hypothetical protein